MEYQIPSISISQMVVFVTVADCNGFKHAGLRLHMTQSAVSKSVAKLEKELQIKLFIRSTRSLELTEAGRLLYENWKIQLSALQNSYQQARKIESRKNSLLRIGLMNTARPEAYFSPFIEAFSKQYPEVNYEVESQYMTDLTVSLEDGLFDLVILPDFTRFYVEKRGLKWQYFAKDSARLIMSSAHPLAGRKSLKTKDILDLKFVAVSTFTGAEEYLKDLSERLAPYGAQPDVAHIYKSAYDIRYLFRPDDAVLFVDAYFDYPRDSSDFRILPVTDQKNGAICAWNPKSESALIRNFLEFLAEYNS